MEIYERKNTTRFAVEQLEKLFVSLNEHLEEDISNFNGEKEFFAVVEHDNGLMIGDFLTTQGRSVNDDISMLESMGFNYKNPKEA